MLDIFLKFKLWIENQTSYKLKMIILDNGTKYTSNKFINCVKMLGSITNSLSLTLHKNMGQVRGKIKLQLKWPSVYFLKKKHAKEVLGRGTQPYYLLT